MKARKQVISLLLVLASLIGVVSVTAPAAEAAGTPNPSTSAESNSDVTITQTAEWDPSLSRKTSKAKILIDPNGGTWNGSGEKSIIYVTDYSAQIKAGTFPNPVKPGSAFKYWVHSSDPKKIDLYIMTAFWEPLPDLIVTFDPQGGTPVASQTISAGGRVSQPTPPTREGYKLLGWYRSPTGSLEWDFDTDVVTEDLTLYAKWEQNNPASEILIDPNGGTWNGSGAQSTVSQTDYEAQVKAGIFPDAVKSGSTFQGWTETADPSGTFVKILTASWQTLPDSPVNRDYVVSFDTLGGTPVTSQTVKAGGKVRQPAAPTREGFKFLGWYRDPAGSLVWNFNTDAVAENLTLYAKWKQTPDSPAHGTSSGSSAGSNTRQYVITAKANEGGSIDPVGTISVPAGSSQAFAVRPAAGCSVRNVLVDGMSVGAVNSYTLENVQADHTIEVFFTGNSSDSGEVGLLNTKDHAAFLRGFPGKTFHPYDCMTRGEIAQMFFNLLEDKGSASSAYFSDVSANAWYADAVNTLEGLGIVRGVGHRRFRPEQAVSRAEFTAIAVRFANGTYTGRKTFTDVNQDDWYFDQVMSATGLGWIKGYKDGTFRPDAPILRAEAAAVVNRMLGRKADKNYAGQHASEMRLFPDVASNYWAYYDILEATNAHDFHVDSDNSEIWEGLASSRKKN